MQCRNDPVAAAPLTTLGMALLAAASKFDCKAGLRTQLDLRIEWGTANAALYVGVAFVLDLFSPEEMILGPGL